jgi:PAS domain S-box-containing protein
MKKPIVLIVDDHPSAIESMVSVLTGEGYQLMSASGGAEALRLTEEVRPDLLLLDVMMPDMDGLTVCRAIRANPELAELPVVMVTALDDRESRLAALDAGADDFLSKPVDRAEVRLRVRTATDLLRFRKLSTERARFDQLVRLSPDSILVIDCEGMIHMNNPAAEELFASDSSLVGESLLEYLDHDARLHWLDLVAEHCREQSTASIEYMVLLQPDGEVAETEVSVGPFSADGELPCVQLVFRNVTERNRLRSTVERSERLDGIGRATAGVVHDFNNLLQTIRTDAEVLLYKIDKDSELRDDLTEIVEVTEEGAAIARQLLLFAREGATHESEVDVGELIREMEQILRHMAGKNVTLELGIPEEALPVSGDRARIVQILTNLVTNARDALALGGGGGTITIEAFKDESGGEHLVRLRVSDDGPGIDAESLGQIFEPFFTTKAETGGSGLGLSIVQGIVVEHNGSIEARNRPEGGAVFDLRLPRMV